MYIYAVFGVVFFGANDPRNFRDLGTAFKNVVSMTTMADWIDFLYINYYGCDVYGYSGADASHCVQPKAQKVLAGVYVTTLIIILGNIMMSLFIGVITNRMEEVTLKLRETKEEKAAKKEAVRIDAIWEEPGRLPYVIGKESYENLMRHLNLLSGVRREGEALATSKLPAWKRLQLSVRRLVVHPVFEWLIVAVIVAAAITSGVNQEGNTRELPAWADDLQLAFLILFAVELGVRFLAHFDKHLSFFTGKDKWWNIFDTCVVIVGLVPSDLNEAATVIRLFRLLRILRLVRVIKQLQVVVLSLLQGLKSIFYVAAFMVIIYFVYAVAAVQVYRENDPFHFRSLSNAMVTLFLVSFLEEWRPVFDINYNGCNINEYGLVDGGTYYAAITQQDVNMCTQPTQRKVFSMFFFVSFILISAMVLVSAFVGIVVTSMQSATEQVRDRLAAHERLLSVQHYFALTDDTLKRSGEVFDLLNAGFSDELTAQMLLDKCKLLGIPTNEEFLRLTYATVNGLTDKPFDKADFVLLTALAERAKIIQEKLANEDASGDDIIDVDFVDANLTKSGLNVHRAKK
jgi:type III secretory pathway component EscS